MTPIRTIAGRAYPFGLANVDTDTIIPGHYLKVVTRKGLGRGAFEAIRARPGNVFDNPAFIGAPILIAGANFGCGSSREHAVWAMDDLGIKAVIAPSFSDIFSGNAFKNGILPIVLPQAEVDRLIEAAWMEELEIDLENQRVTSGQSESFAFEIDPFRKHCMLNGLDEIGITLGMTDAIDRFEAAAHQATPWIEGAAARAA